MTREFQDKINSSVVMAYRAVIVVCIGAIGYFLRDNYNRIVGTQVEIQRSMKSFEMKIVEYDLRIDRLENKPHLAPAGE